MNEEISLLLSAGNTRPSGMEIADGVTSIADHLGMPSKYSDFLQQPVENNYAVKPREGRQLMFATLGLSDDTVTDYFPTDSSIRSKIRQ